MAPNSCFLPLDYPVWKSIGRRESGETFRIGAAGGTRTRTAFRPGDFKSPVSAISPPRHCVFAGVLRVTPRFRRAWIHFWQHLLLRETLRNETNETWTIHERIGGSQHADWLFIATGWRPLCAQFRATDQARRKSKGAMAGIGFMTIAAWGGHKCGERLIGKVYTILSALLLACMAALERYPTIQTLHLRGVALKRSVSSC